MFNVPDFLLDLVFPKFCVGCGSMGNFMCQKCKTTINYFSKPVELQIEDSVLKSVYVLAHYDGVIRNAITQLKYRSIKGLGEVLGEIVIRNKLQLPQIDIITAVPLHVSRQKERGFNQSEVIARTIAQGMNVPYLHLLSKTKKTKTQVQSKTRSERLQTLRGAFALSDQSPKHQAFLKGKAILIVDDVLTTGATLAECAATFSVVGCDVFALTIAHGD